MRMAMRVMITVMGAAVPRAASFMYRPATGLTWDPSCMIWQNKTYCYFMYVCGTGTAGCSANETHYGHGLVAVASDGVHFDTHSAFNAESGAVGWFKCMIHKVKDVDGGPMFVMDHGTDGAVTGPDDPAVALPGDRGCPAGTSQCLRFLKSKDALTWEYMYTLHPDPRWVSRGRRPHTPHQPRRGLTSAALPDCVTGRAVRQQEGRQFGALGPRLHPGGHRTRGLHCLPRGHAHRQVSASAYTLSLLSRCSVETTAA